MTPGAPHTSFWLYQTAYEAPTKPALCGLCCFWLLTVALKKIDRRDPLRSAKAPTAAQFKALVERSQSFASDLTSTLGGLIGRSRPKAGIHS